MAPIKKNASMILRAAQSTKGKGLGFRISRLVDRIRLYSADKELKTFVQQVKEQRRAGAQNKKNAKGK